jgi:GntR family transcriptional regulator, rspAB operon transcriptional repressor
MKSSRSPSFQINSLIELEPVVGSPLSLVDRIYSTLKHRILTSALYPASRIVEKEICSEMGVSRTPLREALNRLSLEGLVVLSPYKGYVVAPLSIQDFQNLCELRRILEPETAALAAERATKEDVEQLMRVFETRYTVGDKETYEDYLRANSAFHLALVKCTGNNRIQAIAMSVLDQHQRPLYLGLDKGINAEASTAEHLEIVDAVRNHDPQRARSLMRAHITSGEERIRTALRAAGF